MTNGYVYGLVCALSLYSAYHSVAKAREKAMQCICIKRLLPDEQDQPENVGLRAQREQNARNLNEVFDRFDRGFRREDAAAQGHAPEQGVDDARNNAALLFELLYRTNMGLKCFEDRSCSVTLFLLLRAGALLIVLGFARNYDWAPLVLGFILVIDYDIEFNRLGFNLHYLIGLLFVVVVSIARDHRGFSDALTMRLSNNGPGGAPAAYIDHVAVRRDQKGRFSAIEARKS